MAVNNRTEIKTAVTTALVPTLTLAQHIALLNDEVNESTVFRKDVIASETPIGAAVTVDYSDKDTATVTITVSTTVSFTNIENGDVKYLVITKGAGNTISFAGATDLTNFNIYINAQAGTFLYSISNKNGVIYAKASTSSGTFDPARLPLATTTAIGAAERATQAEVDAGIDNARIVTPSTLRATAFVASQMPLATETAVGARELATQAETDAGSNDITIVTPLKLRTTVFVAAQIPNLAASKITSGTFAAARIPVATETAIGALEIATTAEAQALTATDKIITPDKLADVNAGLRQKIIDIGDWDMDTVTTTPGIVHGLTLANIRSIKVMIRNDSDSIKFDLVSQANLGNAVIISATTVVLSRETGGVFDAVGFSTTPFNRGWIVIDYIN